MKNILIVEDESIVAMEIESYLKSIGHNVIDICSSAECAYNIVLDNHVDLILMDINLHNSNGISAAKKIKKIKDLSIIFLTAYMDEETIDKAIETNPTAYLVKPFNRSELSASIKIALNQSKNNTSNAIGDVIFNNQFSFNTKSLELIFSGDVITLTKRERELLQLFIKHKNQLLTIQSIENEIWPDKAPNDNTRRALVSRLRAKLKHKFINTITSEGYIFKFN